MVRRGMTAVRIAAMAAMCAGLASVGPMEAGVVLLAQEGHPLTGTWTGEWQAAGGPRTHLTVVMSWDGKAVTGLVNPGPDAIQLTRVVVDWSTWTLVIEGEKKGGDGARGGTVRAEGRIEDIGSARRRIVGTWTEGDAAGELRLTRE